NAVFETALAIEADIGRGKAEIAAALVAVDHLAGHEPGAAEHCGGLTDLPLSQRHPDRAGGNRPFLDIDMGLHVDFDAGPGRFGNQKAGRVDPALAEVKVVADSDPRYAEAADQVMVNEILR